MNVQEMVDEVARSLGNRTDLTTARYVSWLNWSIKRLAAFALRRRVDLKYFHVLEKSLNFQTVVLDGTMNAAPATDNGFWLDLTHVSATVDFYKDCVIEITGYSGTAPDGLVGQIRTIPSSLATGWCYIDTDWDVTPDANTEYSIYRRIYAIGTSPLAAESTYDTFWAIQRMEKVADGLPLTHKAWEDIVGTSFTAVGNPSAFARRGANIVFDSTPNTEEWFRIWFYAFPTEISADNLTGYSDIPEVWHEAIVLGAVYRGHRALMEPDRAAEARSAWYDELTNMTDEMELEGMHTENRIKVQFS